jgi:hypothetical protein
VPAEQQIAIQPSIVPLAEDEPLDDEPLPPLPEGTEGEAVPVTAGSLWPSLPVNDQEPGERTHFHPFPDNRTEELPPAHAALAAPVFTARQLIWCLATLYLGGAAILLGRWVLGYVALLRLLRHAEPAPARVLQLLNAMAGERPPRLVVSRRLRMPLSCGLLRPTVVLPALLCRSADAATLRWILAHELTHLRRRDAWTALLFAVGQSFYYFVPWFWSLRRQVRLWSASAPLSGVRGRRGRRRRADAAG